MRCRSDVLEKRTFRSPPTCPHENSSGEKSSQHPPEAFPDRGRAQWLRLSIAERWSRYAAGPLRGADFSDHFVHAPFFIGTEDWPFADARAGYQTGDSLDMRKVIH